MHILGFLSLMVFSDPMGNPQNPCGMQKLTDNFSVHQCLWKTSTLFPGLSASITETPDQLCSKETSLLQSGQCGTSGLTSFPCFTTLGPMLLLMSNLYNLWAAAPSGSTYCLNPQNMDAAASSNAWNLHVYTWKPGGGAPEKN